MTRRVIHASLDLLDRQVLDRDDEPVGKVDDLEFSDLDEAEPRLTAILLGPQAYGQRLGGRLGQWITSTAVRLAGTDAPIRIPTECVDEIGASIKVTIPLDEIERAERLDHWLRDHLIDRIPGADSASG